MSTHSSSTQRQIGRRHRSAPGDSGSLIHAALVLGVFLLVCEVSGPVHAYLDPGTGSMVLQAALGAIVGALAIMKLHWRRVKSFLLKRQNENQSPFSH